MNEYRAMWKNEGQPTKRLNKQAETADTRLTSHVFISLEYHANYDEMRNWVLQGLFFDINPSPINYIKSKKSHFHFCKKEDPTITASLYLDDLAGEITHEVSKQTSVNKKSLTLSVVKKILENKNAKQELIALLEKREMTPNGEIKEFLDRIAHLIHNPFDSHIESSNNEDIMLPAELPVRTYVIATHIYLELNNNELHYETFIRDTTALKEFIMSKFKAGKLSARIADIKSFSYKKILAGKNNDGAKGQLKPQLKQIVSNPEIFGKNVSAFCAKILKEHFDT